MFKCLIYYGRLIFVMNKLLVGYSYFNFGKQFVQVYPLYYINTLSLFLLKTPLHLPFSCSKISAFPTVSSSLQNHLSLTLAIAYFQDLLVSTSVENKKAYISICMHMIGELEKY